jgi:antibiotic biosynthesis monooxygenase (ABM) superfamily enzyme
MAEPVTVCISRMVKPGCEEAFEEALRAFVQRSLTLPGQLGVHIMRPAQGSGSRQYGVVRKFADRDALAAFRASPLYEEWQRTALELTEGDAGVEELAGLESWFTVPGAPLRPLPKWKMALVTLVGVYPTSLLLGQTLGYLTRDWHFLLGTFAFAAAMVALLTWAVMPLLTRLLRGWLHPKERRMFP